MYNSELVVFALESSGRGFKLLLEKLPLCCSQDLSAISYPSELSCKQDLAYRNLSRSSKFTYKIIMASSTNIFPTDITTSCRQILKMLGSDCRYVETNVPSILTFSYWCFTLKENLNIFSILFILKFKFCCSISGDSSSLQLVRCPTDRFSQSSIEFGSFFLERRNNREIYKVQFEGIHSHYLNAQNNSLNEYVDQYKGQDNRIEDFHQVKSL